MSGISTASPFRLPGPQISEIQGTNFLNLRQALANVQLGTGVCSIVVIGHSVPQGYNATTNNNGWAQRLIQLIGADLGVGNPPNYVPLSANVAYNQSATIAPGALNEVDDSGFAGEAAYIPVGSTATFPTITADRLWFHCQKGPNIGGGFTYTVNGGLAQGPVAAGAAPRKGGRIWDHGAMGAAAATTVVVTPDAVFGSVLEGITYFNGNGNTAGAQGFITAANAITGVGLRHWVCGHFGSQTSYFTTAGFSSPVSSDANSQAVFTDPYEFVQPNCVIIELGLNDVFNGISVGTFINNIQTMRNMIIAHSNQFGYARPTMIWIADYGRQSDTIKQYIPYALSAKTFCYNNLEGFVDFSQLFGTIPNSLTSDGTHPSNVGHRILANYMHSYIMGI